MPNQALTIILENSKKARSATIQSLKFAKLGDSKQQNIFKQEAFTYLTIAEKKFEFFCENEHNNNNLMLQLFLEEHLETTRLNLTITLELIELQGKVPQIEKLRIMLICASGMSSGMLMKKMNEWARVNTQALEVQSFGIGEYLKFINDYDIILVGPQMNHHVQTIADSIDKPVKAIPPLDFAVGNVDNIMKMIHETM